MRFFDIGANLSHSAFAQDLPQTLERARQAEGERIGVPGTTGDEIMGAARIAQGVDLHATAGVHPHHARDGGPQTIPALRSLAAHPRIVAIGECGLDFNRNYSPHPDQERWFVAQLELGLFLDKPLFLHSRDAPPRFYEILKHHRVKRAVAHCFTGERDELRAYLELDLYIGITGWICDERPGRHLLELAKPSPSPSRAATSPPFCRISRARWRARSAARSRSSPPTPRATPAGFSACMNLVQLLLRSARWLPERPALALGPTPVRSYRQMAARVSQLSSGLSGRLGLKRGDRVALAMKNCPEFYEVLFACWHAGMTAVPMNAKLHPRELAYILENSGAR